MDDASTDELAQRLGLGVLAGVLGDPPAEQPDDGLTDTAGRPGDQCRRERVAGHQYVTELTYLLFLKMADEQTKPPYNRPAIVPAKFNWESLLKREGDELEAHYRHILEELGKQPGMLGEIFKKARPEIQNTATTGYGGMPTWFVNVFGWGMVIGIVVIAFLLTAIPWGKRSNARALDSDGELIPPPILDRLVATDATVIAMGLPDIGAAKVMAQPLRSLAGWVGRNADRAVQRLAARAGAHYVGIDVSPPWGTAAHVYLAADRWHPNNDTYRVWADRLARTLGGLHGAQPI